MHIDRHALEGLPSKDDELAQWLEDRWVAKGERLEKLRQLLVSKASWGTI